MKNLLLVGVVALMVSSPFHAAAEGPAEATHPAAAVVARIKGGVWVDRSTVPAPLPAHLGMRLLPGDSLRTEHGGEATIYLPGGALVSLPGGNRLDLPEGKLAPPPSPGPEPRLSVGSLKILEPGLWMLSAPEGSLLMSPMRSGGESMDTSAESPHPLSPRDELVLPSSPSFYWNPRGSEIVIVVGHGGTAMWRSAAVTDGHLVYPEGAPALKHGSTYEWWLESPHARTPLAPAARFLMASMETVQAASEFESEVSRLGETPAGQDLISFLRTAYYTKLGSWSRVLIEVARIESGADPGAAGSAMKYAAARMGLDEVALEQLLIGLGAQGTPANTIPAQ